MNDVKYFDCNNCGAVGTVTKKEVAKYSSTVIAGKVLLVPSALLALLGVLSFLISASEGSAGAGLLALFFLAFPAAGLGFPGFILTAKKRVLYCSKCGAVKETL